MKPKVSIVRCGNYDPDAVEATLKKSLALLGGLEQYVKPGDKVLIKPNVLSASAPDEAVTTHPAVVHAVAKAVKQAGGVPLVGDCPSNAHASVMDTLEKTGIKQAAESAGATIVLLPQTGVVEVKSPSNNQRLPSPAIAKLALEADVIINLPKIKTHNLTAYTGAIKNMFGVVPGFNKSQAHKAAMRPRDLAEVLVDVFAIAKPRLNIMDGIIGMEGNGPGGGEPRKLGLLMASSDAVALDAVASYLIGFEPMRIETTRIAQQRGLGTGQLAQIEIAGEQLEAVAKKNWRHSVTNNRLANLLPEALLKAIKPLADQVRVNPEIDQDKCTRCLVCVNHCPVKTIDHDKSSNTVKINLKNCINCFCCHEMCEYKAIKLKPTWLTKLLRIPF